MRSNVGLESRIDIEADGVSVNRIYEPANSSKKYRHFYNIQALV